MIIPEYEGNFSQGMDWQFDRLNQFVKTSDLRTTVRIRKGNESPQVNYVNLGEVLAFRKIADPLDVLRKYPAENLLSEVVTDLDTGQAAVYINDEVLTEDILNKSQGRFNQRVFMEKFNFLVSNGLSDVLKAEKGYMGWKSTKEVASKASLAALSAGLTYFAGREIFTNGITELIMNSFINALGIHNVIARVPDSSLVGLFSVKLAQMALFVDALSLDNKLVNLVIRRLIELHREDGIYLKSGADLYNPLKHLGDLRKGSLYLESNGSQLIVYSGPKLDN